MNTKQLIRFDRHMKRLEEEGIIYNSFLTTNGSLLNKEILSSVNFDKIQLTFDGDKEFHERYKPSEIFGYHDLLNKITDIMVLSKSNLRIRFNICKQNSSVFKNVLKDIFNQLHIDIERIDFHFNIMRNFHKSESYSELTIKEFSRIDWELRQELKHYGVKLMLAKPIKTPCQFTTKLAICLGPDLKAYYCSSSEKVVDHEISLIDFINNKNQKLSLPKICCKCSVLPLCMYNCRLFENPEDVCITENFHLVDMLKDYINNPNQWKVQ